MIHPVLSIVEQRVLLASALGATSREIAAVLSVSAKDIEYHLANLMRKFEAPNRVGLVSKAHSLGYLSVGRWPPLVQGSPPSRDRLDVTALSVAEALDSLRRRHGPSG